MENLVGKTIKIIQYGLDHLLIKFTDEEVIKFYVDHTHDRYEFINYTSDNLTLENKVDLELISQEEYDTIITNQQNARKAEIERREKMEMCRIMAKYNIPMGWTYNDIQS